MLEYLIAAILLAFIVPVIIGGLSLTLAFIFGIVQMIRGE